MGLFSSNISVPEWASFFTEKEYAVFIHAVDSYFQKTPDLGCKIQDSVVILEKNEFLPEQLGLSNLARICKQKRRGAYPEIVAMHFDRMKEDNRFQNEFAKIEKDYEKIKQYIAARFYDEESMSYIGKESFVVREFAGTLFAALAFDFPNTITNIKPEQIAPWGKTTDELFETGLENVRRNYRFNIQTIQFGSKNDFLYACETEHFFAPNLFFELEAHSGLLGKGGALLAAPTRNIAFIYPINDLKVVEIIKNICTIVPKLYHDNPGSLTKEIYWYKDGKVISLPYDSDQDNTRFSPPEEFIDLLNQLA